MARKNLDGLGELALYSLLKNPFLVPSLVLHLMIFYFLATHISLLNPDQFIVPIPISFLELGGGRSQDKSIGPDRGAGGPRTSPKLGKPEIPRQSSGRVNTGSSESSTPSKESAPAPEVAPALPGPKVLAEVPRPFAVKETSADSLVQLPTKDSAKNFAPAVNPEIIAKSLAATKGTGETEAIRALKEGTQIPGALKEGGTAMGPYGVPGGSREGSGTRGGGTGAGSGGGSNSGLKGTSGRDYNQYLKLIEKRVFSVWRYPDSVTGVQKVSVRFTLDRAGKLTEAEVLDSTDSRINSSAIEAMKKASPFPPIPEGLKDLAGEPLIIRFTLAIRVRG
jgi:TonB family protein